MPSIAGIRRCRRPSRTLVCAAGERTIACAVVTRTVVWTAAGAGRGLVLVMGSPLLGRGVDGDFLDLDPGVAVGRADHRVDDACGGMGVGGAGRRWDAVADGLEEALALDHLQVAEAHRVAGSGLEVREVRVPGRRVNGRVAGVF